MSDEKGEPKARGSRLLDAKGTQDTRKGKHMALFTKGKGSRQNSWEIERHGTLVRAREGGPSRVPGYLVCESELAAQTRVETMVADWLAKGFSAADPEAETLAASARAQAAPLSGPGWPLRKDCHIDNEANGMMVTSMAMAGQSLEEGSEKWLEAINDAKMIPLRLAQDSSFNVRIVGGQDLESQEAEEWVARLEWPLEVPDGRLAICTGAQLVGEEYDADDERDIATVSVPKGRYLVTLYTHLPGVNGAAALDHLAGGYGKARPTGAWWRATHQGEAMPTWLRQWCVAYRSTDPGHESEWEDVESLSQDEVPAVIDFLVHLQPDPEAAPAPGLVMNDGWFDPHEGARQPERCPRGLEAKELPKPRSESADQWIYAVDLDPVVARFPLSPLAGGELPIAPSQLSLLYRLARFCNSFVGPQFQAEGELRQEAPFQGGEGCVLVAEETSARLLFSSIRLPKQHQETLQELAPWLSGLPVGTRWELCCAPTDPGSREGERPLGLHRYRGEVAEAGWVLKETYPRVARSELEAALELARQVEGGEQFILRGEDEAASIRASALANPANWLEEEDSFRPLVQDGAFLLSPPDPDTLATYGATAFGLRHRATWPVSGFDDVRS